jgi:hypothetical protein
MAEQVALLHLIRTGIDAGHYVGERKSGLLDPSIFSLPRFLAVTQMIALDATRRCQGPDHTMGP